MSINQKTINTHRKYEILIPQAIDLMHVWSISRICKTIGVDRDSFINFLVSKNLYTKKCTRKIFFSDEILEDAYNRYIKNDESISHIAETYNINRKTLSKDLKQKYGLKILADGKKEVNDNYFNNIDTEEKAYWLGFLYADGYNSGKTIELCLQEQDKNHLEQFKNAIKSKHKISSKEQNGFISYRISIRSKNMSDALAHYGCIPNKTYNGKWVKNVNPKFIPDFIRGYFDGDGCFYSGYRKKYMYGRICFTSASKNFFDEFSVYLNKNNIVSHISTVSNNIKNWRLDIWDKKSVYNFFNLIYHKEKNTTPKLMRKYKKFELYINQKFCRPKSTSQEDFVIMNGELSGEAKSIGYANPSPKAPINESAKL